MKFTDGYWNMRKDVVSHFAAMAYDIKANSHSVEVIAPTKKIVSRGDTLNLPVLKLCYCAPHEDVIKVSIKHFDGSNQVKPSFDVYERNDIKLELNNTDESLSFKSGNLNVRICKDSWRITFESPDGILTESCYKDLGYIEKADDSRYIQEALTLTPGTLVYGLGERFTPFVKNGQVVDIWNEDGGTSSEIAYKNVPFYITNKNYGVFVSHTGKVSFEVASEKVSKVQFSVEDEGLTYYIIYGKTPKEIITKYTTLTGRPALPPAWSFGLWLTTSFTTSYDEDTVSSMIKGMAEQDIPLHVFHYDCFWMHEFKWCDFKWDSAMFNNPKAMLNRLKADGLKICVWINPYIAQNSELFYEGKINSYLLLKENGDVYQTDKWQAGMGIVDFTNPKACKWYKNKLALLLDMGVDCFKTDFGERIPVNVKYHNNAVPEMMHNYYTYLYNKCVFELLEEKRGRGEACLFARSATAGSQKFPVHWGGDCSATYESMAETLRGGLSLALSGFSFWSHDISGFESTATPDLYKRWAAFGLLSTHSRLHGSSSYRVPWNFDEEASDVLRFFVKLKCSLMPYIFAQSVTSCNTGVPVMRPMMLEYNNDPVCDYLDMQYMLGDSLIVAPIFNDKSTAKYYLPEGIFTNLITGDEIKGGRYITEKHSYFSLPLLVKENTVIPTNKSSRPDYDYYDGVIFNVFRLKDRTETFVTDSKGRRCLEAEFIREGNSVLIKTSGENKNYSVLLWNVTKIEELSGAQMTLNDKGILLTSCTQTLAFVLCE